MQAIANALEGMTRAEAARLAGMERQALRDAVVRYNAEGLAGLHDRPRRGPKPKLTEDQFAELRQLVLDGPEIEATGLSAWTLAELCREVEARWGVCYHEGHMSKLMRKLGLSRQKARPSHPKANRQRGKPLPKGASGRTRPDRHRASRQTPDALVPRRGAIWTKGPCMSSLVHPRPASVWLV